MTEASKLKSTTENYNITTNKSKRATIISEVKFELNFFEENISNTAMCLNMTQCVFLF